MGVAEDIKNSLDIMAVVSRYVGLQKAGRNFKALCPFHVEKTPSFYVFPDRQSWHCFGACGTGGDLFSFVMKKEGIGFGEALQILAAQSGISLPERAKAGAEDGSKERLKEINEAAALYFHNLLLSPSGRVALAYLAGRGIREETAREFLLGYSLDSRGALRTYLTEKGYPEEDQVAAGLLVSGEDGNYDRFRGRLMFPIRDPRGKVVGLGARALDDSLPKYLNSPQTPIFDKSGLLYGLDRARGAIRQNGLVVMVEGYMDVISAHQHGATNVVASMGTSITEKQVSLLKGVTRNLALALDADTAGGAATLRGLVVASQALGREVPGLAGRGRVSYVYQGAMDGEVWIVALPRGKDPDQIFREDPEMWTRLIENRKPLMDHIFKEGQAKFDLTQREGKAQLVEELIPIIREIPNSFEQVDYRERLESLVGLPKGALMAALRRENSYGAPENKRVGRAPEEKALTTLPTRDVLEEYCLSLLLKSPYLREAADQLKAEHFFAPENRQVFEAWSASGGETLEDLQKYLDPALVEHFFYLVSSELPPMEEAEGKKAVAHCAHRLEERRLRDMSTKLQFLIEEVEERGRKSSAASGWEESINREVHLEENESFLALQRQAVEVNRQLGELFKNATYGAG